MCRALWFACTAKYCNTASSERSVRGKKKINSKWFDQCDARNEKWLQTRSRFTRVRGGITLRSHVSLIRFDLGRRRCSAKEEPALGNHVREMEICWALRRPGRLPWQKHCSRGAGNKFVALFDKTKNQKRPITHNGCQRATFFYRIHGRHIIPNRVLTCFKKYFMLISCKSAAYVTRVSH